MFGIGLLMLPVGARAFPADATWNEQRPAREDENPKAKPTLPEVRAALAQARIQHSYRTLGPIGLAGFNWAQELILDGGWVVMAVSCNLGGGLLVFDSSAKLAGSWRTSEINSIQMFDFDEDGTQEIVAEQKDSVGTGLATWNWHLYRVNERGLTHLWAGLSYALEAIGHPPTERQGFIRFVPSGWGDPAPKIVHVVGPVNGGRFEQRVYVWHAGRLEKRDWIIDPRPAR